MIESVRQVAGIRKFYDRNDDFVFVYVVAVPSADFTVKSVKVFKEKEKALVYWNTLFRNGENPDYFETEIE